MCCTDWATVQYSAGPRMGPASFLRQLYVSCRYNTGMLNETGKESDVANAVADEAVTSGRSLPRNVKILGGVSLLNDVASEAIFPLLPSFLSSLSPHARLYLGLIEGAADSVASILKLWSGGWSDRAGRRKGLVLAGYSATTILRPLLAVIVAPWQLLVIRVGDRIGKGVRTSPRDALIADSIEASMRGRAFGFHRAMDHLGAAIGPLLASGFVWMWPEPNHLRILFFLTILPGLLVVALLLFGLREPPAHKSSRQPLRLTLRPFDRNFRLYLLSLAVFTLGNSSDAFLLVRAGELGVPTWQLPILWCIFHIAKSTGNLLLGRAVDRFGARVFLFLGWLVYAAIYLAFALAKTPQEVWLFFLCYALFYGLTEPAEKTLVVQLAGTERKGLAFGWYNFALGLAALPSSLIFGALYQYWGARWAFGWGAALALVAVILFVGVRQQNEPEA
jgi:MFS family permease